MGRNYHTIYNGHYVILISIHHFHLTDREGLSFPKMANKIELNYITYEGYETWWKHQPAKFEMKNIVM